MPNKNKVLGLLISDPTSLCLPVKSHKWELYFMFVSHKYILIDNVNKLNFITHLERLCLHPGSVLPSRRAEQCTIVSKCLHLSLGPLLFGSYFFLPRPQQILYLGSNNCLFNGDTCSGKHLLPKLPRFFSVLF